MSISGLAACVDSTEAPDDNSETIEGEEFLHFPGHQYSDFSAKRSRWVHS
jgi:hypothetical protein